ncbi:hypothetical protein Tco_0246754 [Tanacetum coccineum]
MGIRDIPKFCNATLEKVLKKVYNIVCVARYGFKDPPLGELDREIMELFDTKIKKVLKKVYKIVCVARYGFKDPPLGELDREIMELFDTKIKKRLKHQRHMRRYGYCKNHKKRAKNRAKTNTRWKEYTRAGIYQAKCKRSTWLQEGGIATLAIHVPLFNPTAKDQFPMIRREQGLRSSGASKDLEHSPLAYKRSFTLTHAGI